MFRVTALTLHSVTDLPSTGGALNMPSIFRICSEKKTYLFNEEALNLNKEAAFSGNYVITQVH